MENIDILLDELEKKIEELKNEREELKSRHFSILTKLQEKLNLWKKREIQIEELIAKLDRYLQDKKELKDAVQGILKEIKELEQNYNFLVKKVKELNEKIFNLEHRLLKLEKWMQKQ